MSNLPAGSAGRACAIAATLTTSAAIAFTLVLAVPERCPLVVTIACALAWGLGGTTAVALIPSHLATRQNGTAVTEQSDGYLIGTLMNLGRVPDQVARMTSAVAAASGPVVLVVPPDRTVPMGLDPAVVVVESRRPNVSKSIASLFERCDAVLAVSARAMPTTGLADAIPLLARGVSWVQGSVEPLNQDRFGPTERESLDAGLRRRATSAGLWCWEPDATVISTDLLRKSPLPVGRPLGAWLRRRASEGATGAVVNSTFAKRAAPVAAEGYWPDTTARQCAAAADLSDAAQTCSGSVLSRVVAAGLLVRALSGWSVLLWLTSLVLLVDGSPVRRSGGVLAGLLVLSGLLRWLTPRLATGTRPSPISDLLAGLYGLPGSLAATVSAVTRRVRPPRRAVSTRPLVWLGLIATAAAASVVLTAAPGVGSARLAAGAAAGLLLMTWVFTVRSLIERKWRRVGFRIPLDLPATVGVGVEPDSTPAWRLIDGGPGGFAVVGPATGHAPGDEVTVRVPQPGEQDLELFGTVAGLRLQGPGEELLGIELITVSAGAAAWARTVTTAAAPLAVGTSTPVDESVESQSWGQRADRLAVGLVITLSVAVVLALGLVLVGLRPLVIRSGSMVPTYKVGDVVLVATEPATSIREGQVVTRFDAPEANDSLTHRVQRVSRSGDQVEVMTKGDANKTSEQWSVPANQPVGRVVASVPGIGMPLTIVRSSSGWAAIVGAVVLLMVAMLFRPRRRKSRPEEVEVPPGSLKPTGGLPNSSAMSRTGAKK